MNTWKVILATLVIFAAGVVTGGLLVSYSDRAQQKQHRYAEREASNRRSVERQINVRSREPVAPPELSAPRTPGFSGGLPQGLRLDLLQRIGRELQLTPEQRARVERIIAEGQERNRQLWDRVLPEMRREMQNTKERIRAELTPDQIRRFEELMKQRPSRRTDDPMFQPERRLRDQPRRLSPPRDGTSPESAPSPRPPENP